MASGYLQATSGTAVNSWSYDYTRRINATGTAEVSPYFPQFTVAWVTAPAAPHALAAPRCTDRRPRRRQRVTCPPGLPGRRAIAFGGVPKD